MATYNNGLWTPDAQNGNDGFWTPPAATTVPATTAQTTQTTQTTTSNTATSTAGTSTTSTSSSSESSSSSTSATSASSSNSSSSHSYSSSASSASASASQSAHHKNSAINTIWPLLLVGAIIGCVGLLGWWFARRRKRNGQPSPMATMRGWFHHDDNEKYATFDEKSCRYSDVDAYQDDAEYTAHLDSERGWVWGKRTSTLPEVPPKHQELNHYLAESRTSYTPVEGQQMMDENAGGFVTRKLSKIYSSLTSNSSKGTRLAYNSSIRSRDSWAEHGYLEDQSSSVYSHDVHRTPTSSTRASGFASQDTPVQAPPSIQTSESLVSRSVKRWQLSDGAVPPFSPEQQNTPRTSRYGVLPMDSPSANRAPSSLRPARPSKKTTNPISPPKAPNLFYSSSPVTVGPGSTNSLSGMASLAYPTAYDDSQSRTELEDPFTVVSSASPRRQKKSPTKSRSDRVPPPSLSPSSTLSPSSQYSSSAASTPRIRSVRSMTSSQEGQDSEHEGLMERVRVALQSPNAPKHGREHLLTRVRQALQSSGGTEHNEAASLLPNDKESMDSLEEIMGEINRLQKR